MKFKFPIYLPYKFGLHLDIVTGARASCEPGCKFLNAQILKQLFWKYKASEKITKV